MTSRTTKIPNGISVGDCVYKSYLLDQVEGDIARSKGKISNLPKSIVKERITVEKSEYAAKLEAGPTPPKPGPMLLMQAVTAEKLVSNILTPAPKFSKDISRKTIRNITI